MLDDIVVARRPKQNFNDAVDWIKVRFVYSPKQRVLLDLLDKAQNIQLPVVAFYLGGINRDPARAWNKLQGFYAKSPDPAYTKNIGQPNPIDITLNCSILTKYAGDMDQILTNLIAWTNPQHILSWRIPAIPDQEIRSPVIWNGAVNTTYPMDLNATQIARYQADTSFTIKGWIFKSIPSKSDAKIFKIYSDFSLTTEITTKYSMDDLDTDLTDRVSISAVPQPQILLPSIIEL
jgi:hypothetical protein